MVKVIWNDGLYMFELWSEIRFKMACVFVWIYLILVSCTRLGRLMFVEIVWRDGM